jgi:hypothetical protein
MLFFNYRWDKYCFLNIGGTYVNLIEGGTNVGQTNVGRTNVGRTNVGRTNVGRTNVGGRKVASSMMSQNGKILVTKTFGQPM